MIIALRRCAHALEQIDRTIVAKAFAELSGGCINRDQAGIDRSGVNTFGAGSSGWRIGLFEITDPTAGLAENPVRIGVCFIAPFLPTSLGIQRNDIIITGADIEAVSPPSAASLQRAQLLHWVPCPPRTSIRAGAPTLAGVICASGEWRVPPGPLP